MRQSLLQNKKNGFTPPTKLAGFTMVETLVAISILLVVIIGPMTIAQKGIQNAYFARDQLTAVFLAQEAIEAVRELRDNQGLVVYDQLVQNHSTSYKTWDWFGGFHDASCFDSGPAGGCKFDPDTRTFEACGANDACKLRITDDGKYTYVIASDSNPSIFVRKVYIEKIGTNAVKVRVVVTWNATALGGAPREVKLETWLYDRYKYYEN